MDIGDEAAEGVEEDTAGEAAGEEPTPNTASGWDEVEAGDGSSPCRPRRCSLVGVLGMSSINPEWREGPE